MRDLHRRLEEQQRQLKAFNPYEVLRRGFSITRTTEGKVIESLDTLSKGDPLETLTRDGRLISTLEAKTSNSDLSDESDE